MIFENKIKKIEKGCGRNTNQFPNRNERRYYYNCGDLMVSKDKKLCSICKTKLELLKDLQKQVQDKIDEVIDRHIRNGNDIWVYQEEKHYGMSLISNELLKSLGEIE